MTLTEIPTTAEIDPTAGPSPVRAVERACAVMCSFSLARPRLSLAELAADVGLPKPTVYRIASTLISNGFMSQSEDGRYGLGPRHMELGAVVRQGLDVVRSCTPAVDELAQRTGETIVVAQPDWETRELLIVTRRDSPHALSICWSPVGSRSPVETGCLGKALLSGLDEIDRDELLARLEVRKHTPKTVTARNDLLAELAAAREAGFAVERDEFVKGVSGVAAPVLFDGSRPTAVIGVIGPSSRMQSDDLEQIGLWLLDVTRSL